LYDGKTDVGHQTSACGGLRASDFRPQPFLHADCASLSRENWQPRFFSAALCVRGGARCKLLEPKTDGGSLRSDARTPMPATILDGTRIAHDLRSEVAAEVKTLSAAGVQPGLAVILAGHNPASEIYVRGKVKACAEIGIYSEEHKPGDSVTTTELLALIDHLNRRDEIDGILVQLPLPVQVDAKKVLLTVDPAKDVDGFHPVNVGFLSTQRPGLVPCTPAGCM
jgi:hypothetical protein